MRKLNSPLLILRARKFLTTMAANKIVRIMATESGTIKDFKAFARQTGNKLLGSAEAEGEIHFAMKY